MTWSDTLEAASPAALVAFSAAPRAASDALEKVSPVVSLNFLFLASCSEKSDDDASSKLWLVMGTLLANQPARQTLVPRNHLHVVCDLTRGGHSDVRDASILRLSALPPKASISCDSRNVR